MPDKKKCFLTIDEALEAIGIDFAQYPSQLNLLTGIWAMVFGDDAYLLREPNRRTVWAKTPKVKKPYPARAEQLAQQIVAQLKRRPPDPEHLARICSRVFGATVTAGSGPGSDSSPGIWIDTDMTGFVCIRCGRCCRTLNYHDGCSLADYRRWQDLGRTDILGWVGTIRKNGQVTACRIWVLPGTNRFAETCPWLEKSVGQGCHVCTIHAARPTICRQYPGSRKHARMTGCRGV